MADLDERLTQLLSDPDTVNRILAVANAIQAQRESPHSEPASATVTPEPEPQDPDLGALFASLLADRKDAASASGPNEPPPASSIAPIAAVLPQLLQAMNGQGNLVKQERVELLRAMRPYLKGNRLQSIERALKMANVTKAATSAMHLLGR